MTPGKPLLMFCPDFCHAAYRSHPLYEKMVTAFEPPLKGYFARQAVLRSKGMLGVITAFAGQWPHATYYGTGRSHLRGDSRETGQL